MRRAGRDVERVTHDAKGNQTDERRALGEERATNRENGTGGADGARRNGKTIRTKRKRRAGSARRDGKPGYHGRETVNHKQGAGKINASRPQQQTQPNKLAVT